MRCGHASDCRIAVGEPYQVIVGPTWEKIRCERHASRPINQAQLVAFDATSPPPTKPIDTGATQPFHQHPRPKLPFTAPEPFDPKAAAAGRDD